MSGIPGVRLLLLLTVALGLTAVPGSAAEPCLEGPDCWALFGIDRSLKLPVYRTHDLHKPAPEVRRGVILIHGFSRNAHRYFPQITKMAKQEGLERETLVVAPSFSIRDDDRPHRRPGELYWKRNKQWRRGDRSIRRPEGRVSSFAAVERLLSHFGDRGLFPNLRKITVVGHSAGGQFVQRFALGHAPIESLAEVRVRYVAANPGSYLYLNGYRPAPAFDGAFRLPEASASCRRYNRYEYGLEHLNSYMSGSGKEAIVGRLRAREVILLLGAEDKDRDHITLNRGCRASLQGRDRLERGLLFQAHLDRFFRPHATRTLVVPGVGHSSRDMFRSPQGRAAIFF